MTRGFTLIELIAALTIMSIVSGLALTGWLSVANEPAEVVRQLESARSRAIREAQVIDWRSGGTRIRFWPDGSSNGGHVTSEGVEVVVDPLTGAIHAGR